MTPAAAQALRELHALSLVLDRTRGMTGARLRVHVRTLEAELLALAKEKPASVICTTENTIVPKADGAN
jgi:hypothetical protein